ncbi:MAG: NAD(+)/NADH kinase [Deltaproteobacteria bacterium]|nr:NAD(+)/NADH kinase [Deltaproteobacteria bacterium]
MVSRPTEYEELLKRHGTRAQAAFFLGARKASLDEIEGRHHAQEASLAHVASALPTKWRRSRVPRAELSRFVFEPSDVIVAVGQDGLVANVAKYLDGQTVIGVDPLPGRNAGALVRFDTTRACDVVRRAVETHVEIESRTMVEARLDDGQRLVALNEIYVGHRTHQSSRYRIAVGSDEERHSSSGLIVASGTGATGWSLSIARGVGATELLPAPTERALAYFVREAWPSPVTGTKLVRGRLTEDALAITSEMNDGGVLFGDGIEDDRITIGWGVRVTVGIAHRTLALAVK